MASSKGNLGVEVLWVVLVLFVVGLGLVFGLQAFSELNDDIQADITMSNESKTASQEAAGNASSTWDNTFVFLFGLLWMFLLIAASFANTNPVFAAITIIFVLVALVLSTMLANVYEESVTDPEITEFKDEFPKTNWIIEHILLVAIFMGFSFMMVVYTRT